MMKTVSATRQFGSVRLGRRAAVGAWLLTLTACASHKPSVAAPTAARTAAQPLMFTATAYCMGHKTAAGTSVSAGVVAADPAVLPIGTLIRITGAAPYDGAYRVLDTGARVRNHHVDLYIADCAAAKQFGRRSVRVTIVEPAR